MTVFVSYPDSNSLTRSPVCIRLFYLTPETAEMYCSFSAEIMTIVKTLSVFKMQCFKSTMGIRGDVQRKCNNLFILFLKKQQILTMLIKHTPVWYYVHTNTKQCRVSGYSGWHSFYCQIVTLYWANLLTEIYVLTEDVLYTWSSKCWMWLQKHTFRLQVS